MNLLSALKAAAFDGEAGIVFVRPDQADEFLAYRDLYSMSLKVLGGLQERGLQQGDELVFQIEENKDFIVFLWACIMGGVVPIPLSCGVQDEHKLKLFKVWKYLSNPSLVCSKEQLQRMKAVKDEAVVELQRAILEKSVDMVALLSFANDGVISESLPGDIAYVQFSSGSTGDPKGVCLTHDNLLNNTHDIIKSLEITRDDRLLSWMPLTHDMGLIGFHLTGIVCGVTTISIATDHFIKGPLIWMKKAAEYKATVSYSPSSGMQYFLSALERNMVDGFRVESLRVIVNGAEMISLDICEKFSKALRSYGLKDNVIVSAYGLAEASVEVSAMPVASPIRRHIVKRTSLNVGNVISETKEEDIEGVCFVDVGYPVQSCEVRITDDKDNLLPENVIGHIQIRGKNVTSAYYRNPDATKKLFTRDRWLRTGDLGFMTGSRLVITGRLKNIIIINGQNYYPHDIEQVIIKAGLAEPGKAVACAVAGDAFAKEELVIFVLYKGNYESFIAMDKAIKRALRENMGIGPKEVVPIRRIPKTTSGKIQYFLLCDQYRNKQFDAYKIFLQTFSPEQEPLLTGTTDLQQRILALTRELLGEGIDENSSLSGAGINSITALQLVNRISRLTGRHLGVQAIFEYDTIESLARHIGTADKKKDLPVLTASPRSPHYELSLPQMRIWMEYQLNKNSIAYNVPVVYAIEGNLDISLLKRSIDLLVSRHEILRSSFQLVDGLPRQRIHDYPENGVVFNHINLSHTNEIERQTRMICEKEANIPFVLETPSQFRVTFIQKGPDRWTLSFVFHHILIDGWTLTLLFKELSEIYTNLRLENPVSATGPDIQYKDYALWQRSLLRKGDMDHHRRYWLEELAGLPQPVRLSVKGQITSSIGFIHTKTIVHQFSSTEKQHVDALCKHYKTTRFCVFGSVLYILLYRYTGRRDITCGFDVTGRTTPEIEKVTGYVLNTLCLRSRLHPEQTFADVIRHIGRQLFAALEHQSYPFEQLLEDFRSSTDGQHFTLFNILLIYQNLDDSNLLKLPECKAGKLDVPVQGGFTDLLLEFIENGDELQMSIKYNDAIYDPAEIEQLVAHFTNLLDSISSESNQPIGTYDYFTPAEKQLLFPERTDGDNLKRWHLPVHVLFERQASRCPDATAVYYGKRSFSYSEINGEANRLAHYIREHKQIRTEDRIGFKVSRNENIIIAMLAILKTGGAFVAIDPEVPINRAMHMIADGSIKCLLVDSKIMKEEEELFPADFLINMDAPDHYSANNTNLEFGGTLANLAYIIYTSGSTGAPKGIMITHDTLTAYVQQFVACFNITHNDVFIQQASVSFDTMIEEIFPALCTSGKIVISRTGARNIESLLALIRTWHVTVLSTTPHVLREINSQVDSRIMTLRLVISGGDVLKRSDITNIFPNAAIYNTYGPSEATVCVTYKQITSLEEPLTIGKPIVGRNVYILNEDGQLVPPGKTGELHLEGGLARGYLNQDELSKERFIKNPFQEGGRLYRSGDLGVLRPDGEIEFCGRTDHQVKLRGHRVEPEEIEKMISRFEGVRSAVVVQPAGNDYLVAFLTVGDNFRKSGLGVFLAQCVPAYMIPYRFEILAEMPLTLSGKIDKQALIALGEKPYRQQDHFIEPANEYELALLTIVRDALDMKNIGPEDNFFSLGCNSIKALQIMNRVQESSAVEIRLSDIFIYPTVRQLAAVIMQMETDLYNYIEM